MNKNQKPVLTGQRFKTRKRGRLRYIFNFIFIFVKMTRNRASGITESSIGLMFFSSSARLRVQMLFLIKLYECYYFPYISYDFL